MKLFYCLVLMGCTPSIYVHSLFTSAYLNTELEKAVNYWNTVCDRKVFVLADHLTLTKKQSIFKVSELKNPKHYAETWHHEYMTSVKVNTTYLKYPRAVVQSVLRHELGHILLPHVHLDDDPLMYRYINRNLTQPLEISEHHVKSFCK